MINQKSMELEQWQQIIGNGTAYLISQTIGKGMFGTVYLAVEKDGIKKVAIKQVIKSKLNSEYLLNAFKQEIAIQKSINHVNLVKLYETQDHRQTLSYLMIMEYCKDGDLFQMIEKNGPFPERIAVTYFKQILAGLKAIHEQNIVHRDIKLANIFLNNGVVKIGDFGMSKQFNIGELLNTTVGSFSNMAPEVFFSRPYSTKADIYSVGVILYQMIYGEIPYKPSDMSPLSLYKLSDKGQIDFTLNGIQTQPKIQDLIRKMLTYDQEKRINWKEIYEHSVMTGDSFYPEEVILMEDLALIGAPMNSSLEYYEKEKLQTEKLLKGGNSNQDQKYTQINKNLQAEIKQDVQISKVMIDKEAQLKKYKDEDDKEKERKDGMSKYLHLRNVIGMMIQMLNEAQNFKEVIYKQGNRIHRINYQLPLFLTTKKIIQELKKLIQIMKLKQNTFNLTEFNQLTENEQYSQLLSVLKEDRKKMKKRYPTILDECRKNLQDIRLDNEMINNELRSKDTNEEFDLTYKQCLINYYFSLTRAVDQQNNSVKRNLICHLVLLSEIATIDKLKLKFGYNFEKEKENLKKIPENMYQRKLEKAGAQMFE